MRTGQFRCKHCGGLEGYRSRSRNFFERYLLRLALLRPVRCGQCFRRSYHPVFQPAQDREPRDRGPGTANSAAA